MILLGTSRTYTAVADASSSQEIATKVNNKNKLDDKSIISLHEYKLYVI